MKKRVGQVYLTGHVYISWYTHSVQQLRLTFGMEGKVGTVIRHYSTSVNFFLKKVKQKKVP
jgi:hypothetical protein